MCTRVRLLEEDGYLPDPDALRAACDDRTSLIVLNNPNNPTGALIDEPLLREIVEVARERDAWLFCDEVYRRLEHEPGTTAPSVADLYEKGVSSGSMSKSYSLAGLRTGWVAGPPEIIRRCLDVRDYTTISAGVLDDALAAAALEHRDKVLERSLEIVRGNLAVVDEWIAREPRLHYVRPRAGTIALVHYDYGLPSVDFCQGMFDFNGAFVMPGIAFGEEHSFRLGLRERPRRCSRAGWRPSPPTFARSRAERGHRPRRGRVVPDGAPGPPPLLAAVSRLDRLYAPVAVGRRSALAGALPAPSARPRSLSRQGRTLGPAAAATCRWLPGRCRRTRSRRPRDGRVADLVMHRRSLAARGQRDEHEPDGDGHQDASDDQGGGVTAAG